VSYQTFTNEPCQLWSYFTEFHEIFTRYTGIICAVNAPIDVAISHTVSECQSDKCRSVGNFTPFLHKIGCLFNVPWDIEKSGPDRSSTPRKLSFDVKIVKIGSADLEIICLWEIIKKEDKLENAWQSLAYSPLGTTVSPPSIKKPCYHLANAQRMHVLSVCLYYGKIIAMATSLDKLKNKVQIHYVYVKRFYTVKRLRKSVLYIRRYSTKNAPTIVSTSSPVPYITAATVLAKRQSTARSLVRR